MLPFKEVNMPLKTSMIMQLKYQIKGHTCLPTAFPQYFLLQLQNHQETHIPASVFSGILYIHSYGQKRGEKCITYATG